MTERSVRSALSVKGVCVNRAGEVLLCHNWRDEWELPGGRPERGETFADCLRREVAEETGILVDVGDALDAGGSLEAAPGQWVHIVAYQCRVTDDAGLTGGAEHRHVCFVRSDELGGLRLPQVYRRAIELQGAGADDGFTAMDGDHRSLNHALSQLCLALDLAEMADELSMRRFRAPSLKVETKSDGSPVTDADVAIERVLRSRLAIARPTDSVVGEEGEPTVGSDCCWYLDPIDGTSRFAVGDPRWYTLIGVATGPSVVAGVASAPALGLRWWAARGVGAFCNGQPITVSATAMLAQAAVNDDWRGALDKTAANRSLSIIASRCARVRPHQGHSHLAVAQGDGDIAATVGGGPWDYAPIKVIVEEAGGRFTDLQGNDSFGSGSALVSNGVLHDEALAALARAPGTMHPDG